MIAILIKGLKINPSNLFVAALNFCDLIKLLYQVCKNVFARSLRNIAVDLTIRPVSNESSFEFKVKTLLFKRSQVYKVSILSSQFFDKFWNPFFSPF
jgi:hypothetical protein